MDTKFYDSEAVPFIVGFKSTKREPMPELSTLKRQLARYPAQDVSSVKNLLSVVKPVYSNAVVPDYADLARIDREFGLFDCVKSNITYLSLNNGPGHFDFYVHAKTSNNCSVVAMTETKYRLSEIGLAFYPDRFLILVGDTATANIRKEWDSFLRDFDRTTPDVDFSLCSLPEYSEEDDQFFYANVYLTLLYLKKSHDAVLEMPGTGSLLERQLVFACVSCFSEVNIFKPVTSDLFSSRRYLICKGYKKRKEILDVFSYEQINRLAFYLPDDFSEWFDVTNDEINTFILEQYQNAIALLEGESVEIPSFNQTLIYGYSQILK